MKTILNKIAGWLNLQFAFARLWLKIALIPTSPAPSALSFLGAMPDEGSLIGFLTSLVNGGAPLFGQWNYASVTGNSPTLNLATVPGGIPGAIIVLSGQTTAQTVTTDTATNILSVIPNPYIGQTFFFIVANLNTTSGAATITAGSGVTLAGTNTIPIAGARVYFGKVTAVATPAVTLTGAFSWGSAVAA